MKTKQQLTLLVAAIGIVASARLAQAQHAHLNAGAAGTNQNDQLIWENGADFATNFSYVKTLNYTNGGRFAGYYQGNITATVLPATAAHAGPDPAAPALGSFIQFKMSCLSGPVDGSFGFWDVGTTNPSISLAPGQSSTNLWRLSESNGSPGSDPYGHIHGRGFTATRPGIYLVGFTAVDTSTNGSGGGPIHTDSTELLVWFQAGASIQSVEPDAGAGEVRVRFGATAGYSWQLEASAQLGSAAVWGPAGSPVTGADAFVVVTHTGAPGEQRFYHVKGTPVAP